MNRPRITPGTMTTITRLAARTAVTAAVCWITGTFLAGTPAAPAIQAGIIAWWIITLPAQPRTPKPPQDSSGDDNSSSSKEDT